MLTTKFEYLYRDASNYKAYGSVWLIGPLDRADLDVIVESLEGGSFFVAEQVGIPPLYETLYELSGGPNEDDHAWHTFLDIRSAPKEEIMPAATVWGTTHDLVAAFASAGQKWEPQLSPNFALSSNLATSLRLSSLILKSHR